MKRFTAAVICVVMAVSLCACGSLFGKRKIVTETGESGSGVLLEGTSEENAPETSPSAGENDKSEDTAAEAGETENSADDSGESASPAEESVPPEATPVVTREAEQAEGLNGYFKLVELQGTDGGSREEVKLLEALGMVLYIQFSPDGTLFLHMLDSVETTGNWNDAQITIENEPVNYVLEGDTLTLRDETMVMILTRTTKAEIDAILALAADENQGNGNGGQNPGTADSGNSGVNGLSGSTGASSKALSGQGVLAEDGDYRIEITGYTKDPLWGFTIGFLLENKSDKELMFSIDGGAVNGYMCDPLLAEAVEPGKTQSVTVNLMDMVLLKAGISSPDEIVLHFLVYDNKDWKADNILDENFVIYPNGKPDGRINVPARRTDDDEKTVVDNNFVTVVILDDEDDDVWGYTVECYLENKTGRSLIFTWEDVTVDGKAIDPHWSEDVLPGARAYSTVSFLNSRLQENGVDPDEIREVRFRVKAHDRQTGETVLEENCSYISD